jgi:hypothetical protein
MDFDKYEYLIGLSFKIVYVHTDVNYLFLSRYLNWLILGSDCFFLDKREAQSPPFHTLMMCIRHLPNGLHDTPTPTSIEEGYRTGCLFKYFLF